MSKIYLLTVNNYFCGEEQFRRYPCKEGDGRIVQVKNEKAVAVTFMKQYDATIDLP